MPERELATTRVALLELKDEQRLVREGYQLLDEKRILLAGEIRRELGRLRLRGTQMRAAEEAARAAVIAALTRHGFDMLSVHRSAPLTDVSLAVAQSRFLGLRLPDTQLVPTEDAPTSSLRGLALSKEMEQCIRTHRALLEEVVAYAASSLRVRRLVREFVRTERRTRAIENILVPELDAGVRFVEEQLEAMDQEELARVRRSRVAASGLVAAPRPPDSR